MKKNGINVQTSLLPMEYSGVMRVVPIDLWGSNMGWVSQRTWVLGILIPWIQDTLTPWVLGALTLCIEDKTRPSMQYRLGQTEMIVMVHTEYSLGFLPHEE